MTEHDLIELVETKSPDELTSSELAGLEYALVHSPELRQALSERLELEQYLHAALGGHQVSAEEIMASSSSAAALRARARNLRWMLCLVAVGLAIGATFYAGYRPRGSRPPDAEVAAVAPPDEKHDADAKGAAGDKASTLSADDAAKAGAAPKTDPAAGDSAKAKPPATEVAVAPPAPAAPPAAPTPPPPPKTPWTPLAAIAAEPPPADSLLVDDLPPSTSAPSEQDLRKWFADVPGQPANYGNQNHFNVLCGVFSGVFRLQSPWAPQAALRMSLGDFHRLRIHLWNENEGVTLQFLSTQNRAWLAYRATRKPGQPLPESLVMVGNDEGRNIRVNINAIDISTVDLRCDGKAITLSRRNVPILSVPFAGMPKEVYFEGKAIVRQFQLVRAADLPAPSAPPRPVVLDMKEPAKGQWVTDLGDGAALNQLPDGRAELSLEKIGKAVWAALPLTNDRIQEVILELDDPQPGTGVFLGDATGKSLGGLGFFREQRTGRTAVAQGNPNEHRSEMTIDANDAIQSYCAPKPWVKMLVGCGVNRFWISDDGEHWAKACDPWAAQRAVIGSVGMYCIPGPQPRSIRLRRLIVRELPALAALAPIELRRQAPVSAVDLVASEWLIGACLSQPAGVDARQWRRVCALRTLAANSTASAAPAVIESLVEDLMSDADRPWREQLQLLDETSELRNCWEDPHLALRCQNLYARVGAEAAAGGHPEVLAKAIEAQLLAPLWCRLDPAQGIDDGDRRQILQLVYERNWPQAQALAGYLRMTRRLTPDQDAILEWAEAIAPRKATSRNPDKALLKAEWRHPVVVELSKEAYNVLAELEASLDGKAYRDACQIISTAGNQGGPGLLPDSHDSDLLLSFPNAVRKAMREHPALATAMNEQFGASGRVRVRQAIADEDAVSVEAATLQFCGTQAAAEAHRWLGDRAVASGAFAQAIAHYDECLKTASPDTRAKAVAGSRLAAAMIGRPASDAAVAAADFGDVKLSAAEFTQLLDDLRKSRSTSATGALTTAAAAPATAPAAGGFTAQVRARFDGDTGENPQNVPGEMQQFGIDWFARQCAVVPAGDLLIVSNRFQVSAFNVKSGQYAWRAGLGGEQAQAHDWSLTPMRPLVTMQRVFVRRSTKQGPLLAALDLADGKVLWTTRPEPEKFIISDPAFIQDQLFVLVATRFEQEFMLSLASYDPASGAAVSLRPLARLRESWWQQQRNCQVTPLDDSLVVACAGSVLRVDIAGQIGWLRRMTWMPVSLDRGANLQEPTPPIVAGDRLFVAQPGVREVECLAPESGRLIWQTATPTLRRVVGLAGERLIIQTDAGFAALSTADGKLLWEHPIPALPVPGQPLAGLLDGQLMSGANMLLAAKGAPVGDDRNFTPTLLWIDLATGRESSIFGLDALRHDRPRLGPLAMADGRLFAFSGKGEPDSHRDIIELSAQGPAWSGPTEKQAELAPWRRQIDPALWEAVAEVFPKWTLLGGPTDRKHPLRVGEWQGETQVLEVQAASGRPFSLARRGQVPSGSPKLVVRVASDAKWKLEVQAGDKTIASQEVTRESTGGTWKTFEFSLEPVAGQTAWLVVRQIDIDGSQPMVKWKTLEIRD